MTSSFEELKLVAELVAGAESNGWDVPSGLQDDAMAVIRRGNNVVLHASAGSGVVGAYGLGILDRLVRSDDEPGDPEVLILTADFDTASAIAGSLARLATATDIGIRALGPGWARSQARVLVVSAAEAMAAVRGSALKLDAITALVVHDADLLVDTGQWPAVETLADAAPGSAQRVLVTGRFDDAINGFIEGHVRRAMTVPPRSESGQAGAGAPTVRYAVATDGRKVAATVHLLASMDAGTAVICRTLDRVDELERQLAARGVGAGEGDGQAPVILPRPEADRRSVQAQVLSFDVPFDADEMAALHGKGGAVVVTPRERAHLLRIAARAGVHLEATALPTTPRSAVEELRDRLRKTARGDLTAELALLAPLLADVPAPELAAAAVRIARSSGSDGVTSPLADAGGPAGSSGAAPPPDTGTWVHLFVSIGERDEVGPGDLVGAITGEAGVSGDQVGKIDIRESHSTVEVATAVAGRVIEALNGRTLKGRSLRVDYDRKGRAGGAGGSSGTGDRTGRRGSGSKPRRRS